MRTDRDNLQVVLVYPEIHGNTGSAGRTCLAVGAQLHLVEPLGFSLDEARVRRAGLDYWRWVAPRVWPDWESFERQMDQLGQPYLFSAEGERDLWDVSFAERTVLIFGQESVGLPAELRRKYRNRCVRFPMHDLRVRSLNLATCVALGCYEVLRQRRG